MTPDKRQPKGIYKEQSDRLRNAAIGKDLESKLSLLNTVENRGRIDLHDTVRVKEITGEYLKRCRDDGQIPTVMGLSAALGISRRWLNMFMAENPGHSTTAFLEVYKELSADAIAQAGLGRFISETLSIFILKNCNGWSDRIEIEATQSAQPLGESVDRAALEQRIAGSVVLDDD